MSRQSGADRATRATPGPDRPRPSRSRAAGLVAALPLLVPVALACLGLAVLLAVLAGQHRPWVVVPLTVLLVAVAGRSLPRRRPVPGEAPAALLALVGAAAWAGVGLRGAGQYVVVARDPGFLTLSALWLTDHASAGVPTGAAAAAAAAVDGYTAGAEAFAQVGGALHAQGNSMLPGVLAVAGWWGGTGAVLGANVVVGAVALLAVHALAREVAGPWWGLLPPAGLALCLPMLVLTRSAYTEPLTLTCLAAGTALLAAAVRGRSVRGAGLGGAVVGVAGAARIDGAIVVAGVLVALALAVLVSSESAVRGLRRAQLRAASAGALLLTAVGYLDLVLESPVYLADRLRYVLPLAAVLLLTAAAALLLTHERVAAGSRLARARTASGVVADVAAGTVAAGALVLVTRPWWLVSRAFEAGSPTAGAVGRQQVAEGLVLDPTRSYDEMTLTWAAWYLGWVVVVLGLVGAVVAVQRALRAPDPTLLVVVATVLVAALPYLVRVTITPDQVWAVRRLLPVTFPALLVLAAWLLREAWIRASGRSAALRRTARAAVGVLTASVLVLPVAAWDGVQGVREQDGRLDQAQEACRALDDLGASRVVWVHSSPFQYLATLRVVCDVEVVQTFGVPTATGLAALADAWGGGTVAVMSFDRQDLVAAGGGSPVGTTEVTTLERRIAGRPQRQEVTTSTLWVAVVG